MCFLLHFAVLFLTFVCLESYLLLISFCVLFVLFVTAALFPRHLNVHCSCLSSA